MRRNPMSDPTNDMNIRQGVLKGFGRPPKEVDKSTYEIVGKVERFDRRDDVNSRVRLVPGSKQHEEYYSRHPEFKERDDERRYDAKLFPHRRMELDPTNEAASSAVFGPAILLSMPQVTSIMEESNASAALVIPDDRPEIKRVDVDPEEVSYKIKAMALQLGAFRVRIGKLEQKWVHAIDRWHRYGEKIELPYKYIICMAFPQDPYMLANTVGAAQKFEVLHTYSYASFISYSIAHYIKHLGWPVKALPTQDSPYFVPPMFVDAGIGEYGRCDFCVTKEFGNNWRPGAVVTDMPLIPDKPVDFGLQDFCEKCHICADACPSGAISKGEKVVVNGVKKWQLDADKCAHFWYKTGTCCSICQIVCPFNHTNSWFHNTIRNSVESLPWTRSLVIKGENFFYPLHKQLKPPPKWMARGKPVYR